ncbi:MAG TPA: 1-phosphofructokinase [Thermoanaerobaculia bacterium]|nr:1-phosphofructokinase [Thermoanaerobaculia bacterium]
MIVTVTLNPAIDQTLRIPGFAAGRVNRVAKSRSHAGGKGVNVASFLADLGEDVVATGFLGAENSALFDELFQRKRIVDRFVRTAGNTRVGLKIVDNVTRQTTDINFPGRPTEEEEVEELLRRIAALATQGRWFVLSGSVPPGLSDSVYAVLTELIHSTGGRVVLDTSGRPLREALAVRPDAMKPNIDELSELTGQNLDSPASVLAAAESLLARGVQRVVVSMGGDGAVFVDRDEALLARPPRVPVRSTVGAGDAMVAGIVHAMIHGLPLADVARTATASGAYAVTRFGPGIGNLAELRKLMEQVEIETLRD